MRKQNKQYKIYIFVLSTLLKLESRACLSFAPRITNVQLKAFFKKNLMILIHICKYYDVMKMRYISY